MNRKHNDNSSISNLLEKSVELSIAEHNLTIGNKKPLEEKPNVLYLEPFYGGSHKQLIDVLLKCTSYTFVSLSAKKWPWRARCSALIISEMIPEITTEKVLFCSSVLSLSELLGLRPDLQSLKKIVYFHENQFIYPVREIKDRDIQFAYNQITTCLAADVILFNSNFNRTTLLDNINKIIKMFPDYRPKNLREKIETKSTVLYYPIFYPVLKPKLRDDSILHVVWPHRWEFDKDPDIFLKTMMKLNQNGKKFKLHILGEIFQDVPDIFNIAKDELKDTILHFGFVESKECYYDILRQCHVAVSTAKHEFFGVSMLEAAYCGCFPVVPNRLVYPEIYPVECLYNDENDFYRKLEQFSEDPTIAIEMQKQIDINFDKYSVDNLLPKYLNILSC